VNSVGDSEPSRNGAETWAYVPPPPPSINGGSPVNWPDNTNPESGKTRVTIGSSVATAVLMIDGVETAISGDGLYTLEPGRHEFTVISVDDPSELPPGYIGRDG